MRQTTAQARELADFLQRSVEQELFATRDAAEREALKVEHAELRRISDGIAEQEEAEADARYERWLRETVDEIRQALALGWRPNIYRRHLSARAKSALIQRFGCRVYEALKW